MDSAVPPAASIFARAAAEKACAFTVSAFVSSPRARIFTGRPLCAKPCATRAAGVTSPSKYSPRIATLTGVYSTRSGFEKPFSFGTRRW